MLISYSWIPECALVEHGSWREGNKSHQRDHYVKKFGFSKHATSMNLALEAGDQFEVYPTAQEARAVADKRARETARAPLGFGGLGSAA